MSPKAPERPSKNARKASQKPSRNPSCWQNCTYVFLYVVMRSHIFFYLSSPSDIFSYVLVMSSIFAHVLVLSCFISIPYISDCMFTGADLGADGITPCCTIALKTLSARSGCLPFSQTLIKTLQLFALGTTPQSPQRPPGLALPACPFRRH